MKRIVLSVVVLLVVSSLALAGATKGSWMGVISDARCGAKEHNADCVKKCLAGGQKAVLMVNQDAFTITNPDAIKGHEGHHVKVTGSADMDKKEVTVEKVEMAH